MNVSMLKFNVTVGYSYFVIKKIIEYLILINILPFLISLFNFIYSFILSIIANNYVTNCK